MRLVDQLDLMQEEAGRKMGVSRGTIWRLLQSGRKKVIQAIIVEGRELIVSSRDLSETLSSSIHEDDQRQDKQ